MKNTIIIILSLLFVLFIQNLSLSETKLVQSNLTEIAEKLHDNSVELWALSAGFTLISSWEVFKEELLGGIDLVRDNIEDVETRLDYESQLLLTIPHIAEKYKTFFVKKRIKRLDVTKKIIEINLVVLKQYYNDKKYKSALLLYGNPIPTIESSLQLLDKSIGILRFEIKD